MIQDADVTEDTITVRWDAPASGADTYELTYEIISQGSNSGNAVTGLTTTCTLDTALAQQSLVIDFYRPLNFPLESE